MEGNRRIYVNELNSWKPRISPLPDTMVTKATVTLAMICCATSYRQNKMA